MKGKKAQSERSHADVRASLEADVEAFLASGRKIEHIPTGVSGQDALGGRKHIVLGQPKKT